MRNGEKEQKTNEDGHISTERIPEEEHEESTRGNRKMEKAADVCRRSCGLRVEELQRSLTHRERSELEKRSVEKNGREETIYVFIWERNEAS